MFIFSIPIAFITNFPIFNRIPSYLVDMPTQMLMMPILSVRLCIFQFCINFDVILSCGWLRDFTCKVFDEFRMLVKEDNQFLQMFSKF